MLRSKRFFVVLCLLGALVLPMVSHAQTPADIIISYPELNDVDGALELGLYFTVLDSGGRVVQDAQIKSAQILLDDGERDDNAQVEQPTTPFFITLVLDASGSMGPAADDMRKAAIQAVQDAPDEAQFAVIRFNDKIDTLQDFTTDRNRAINAIGEVQPVNQAGTCLYDATYTAIDMLSKAPPGRRAIILFTDGKDEVLSGQVCSRHTFSDVVSYATQRTSRVPIYTIGLSTPALNPGELQNFATQTGGAAAVGAQQDLSALFTQIMDALKSQWLAKGSFYPSAGQHTATLTAFLNDGTRLVAVTTFEVPPPGYTAPVVATVGPTAVPVNIQVLSVTSDLDRNVVQVEVNVQGQENINEYRFDFFDANTNQLLDRYIMPAPLSTPVELSAVKLNGKIRVEVRALDRNGQIIAWPSERDQTTDKATYDFSIVRPTPTPPPASPTPIPVTAEINSISYSQTTDTISLDLSLTGQERITSLKINIADANTGLLAKSDTQEPATSVEISAEGLVPAKDYAITVIAEDQSGQEHSSRAQKFTYLPPMTPTPTASPTPTATPTLAPVQVAIASISIDDSTQEIVIGVQTEDQDRIDNYQLQLRNSQSGLVVGDYQRTPPPYDSIRIPLSNVPAGEYTAVLRAFGPGGVLVAEASPLNFAYTPPPTPTPIPTATPSPTPTPTPTPGIVKRVSDTVHDNPILALVVGIVAFALIVVLVLIIRPRRKAATGTDFLSAQTGFYQVSPPSSGAAAKEKPRGGDAETKMAPMDPEKTDVFPQALPPLATLMFSESPDQNRVGESVPVTHFPFKIGRGTTEPNDLRLDEDTSISRRHATITYDNATFYLTDENSSNGTAIDGKRLPPNTPMALQNGARVMIGKGTVLIFESADYGGGSQNDPDKTDYMNSRTLR
jgi:VWFA-related protein